MKKAIVLLLTLVLFFAGCGDDAPAFDVSTYEGRIRYFQYDNNHDPNCDFCMLGDSLTDYYDLARYFPTLIGKNRGISGDTTTSLLRRLEPSVKGADPRITLLLIGANNVDTLQNDYEDLVVSIEDLLPRSALYLISMTPTCRAYQGYMPAIRRNNIFISDIAKKYDVGYIDLFSVLLDDDTGLLREEYTVDGQHFSEAGYETITRVLENYLLRG